MSENLKVKLIGADDVDYKEMVTMVAIIDGVCAQES